VETERSKRYETEVRELKERIIIYEKQVIELREKITELNNRYQRHVTYSFYFQFLPRDAL